MFNRVLDASVLLAAGFFNCTKSINQKLHSPDKILKFLNKTIFARTDGNPLSFQEIFAHCVTVRIGFFFIVKPPEATPGNLEKY